MAFDPNSIPKFTRPMNSLIPMTDEPCIPPSVIPNLRNIDGFQGPVPVYYPLATSNTGFTGLGYGGGVASTWRPGMPSPVTHAESGSLPPVIVLPKPTSAISRPSERSMDSLSENRIKFLCSYGGRILPRPSDGMLRYVGGQTRIISLQKDSNFSEFSQKMVNTIGQPAQVKYQLPDEDLDALVSVSCPDDLENMLEEYYKLAERSSSEGSSKLRLFLFPVSDRDCSSTPHLGDFQDAGHQYVDAVNGILDGNMCGLTRKESTASIASTHNSDIAAGEAKFSTGSGKLDTNGSSFRTAMSPKGNIIPSDGNIPKIIEADSIATGCTESSTPQPNISIGMIPPQIFASQSEPGLEQNQKLVGLESPPSPSPLPDFVNPFPGMLINAQVLPSKGAQNSQDLSACGLSYAHAQHQVNYSSPSHQYVTVVQSGVVPPSSGVNSAAIQPLNELRQPQSGIYPNENSYFPQIIQFPNNQNPNPYISYIPSAFFGGGYGFQHVAPTGHVLPDGRIVQPQVVFPATSQKYKDCLMCQKALPHAHSDTVAQDQRTYGVSAALESTPAHHSLCTETDTRNFHMNLNALNWTENEVRSPNNVGMFIPNHGVTVEGGKNTPQKSDNPASVPLGVVGQGYDIQATCGAWPLASPQPRLEDHTQQLQRIGQFQAKQEQFFSRPIPYNPFPTSENVLYGHNDISRKPLLIPSDSAFGSPVQQANTGLIDGRDNKHRKEEFLEIRKQQPFWEELLRDGTSSIPVTAHYPNQGKPPEFLPYSGAPFIQNMRAGEAQYNFLGSNMAYHPTNLDEISHVNSTNYGIDYAHFVERIPQTPERTNQVSQFQQHLIPVNPKAIPLNGKGAIPTSMAPSTRTGDFRDLPSADDPWNFQNVVSSSQYNIIRSPAKDEVPCSSDAVIHQRATHMNNLKADTWLKDDKPKEELINHENQIVASGLAASVHPPPPFSQPSVLALDQHTTNLEHDSHYEDHGHDADKFEDIDTKRQEKPNYGFPGFDEIGHLQIIKNIDLEELCELGSGTFGTVYHGKWRGTDVAIKRINDRFFSGKQSEQEQMRDDFWNEAIKLADLHHPNVVAFYGVVLDGTWDSVATVTEYMVNGSLRNNLQKNEKIMDKRKRLLICMDVAFGMEYLHGRNIVHFDLKSDNLLVNLRDPLRPICKVGDLGLSKVKCRTLISGGVRGTLPWMAPELLNGSSSLVSEKVDVFSFGVVMWELLTGDEPYADLHYGAIIGGIVSNSLRPSVPETCETEWRSLMERCWSTEPSERPSFTEIAAELRSMAAPRTTSPKGGVPQQQQPPFLQK